MEYEGNGEMSCCMAGEVMNTVRNRQNEYTVRILHPNGYESVYSGLSDVCVQEGKRRLRRGHRHHVGHGRL